MLHGLISELSKWTFLLPVVHWLLKRARYRFGPLFGNELLQHVPPLDRRINREGTFANRSQPDPNPGRRRAIDGMFSLTYRG
jgi:hypothetical protein